MAIDGRTRYGEEQPNEKQPDSDERLQRMFADFARRYRLTPREIQVMRLLVLQGLRNDDMAACLHISPKTLKNHIACLMKKTRTGSSRELQALFFRLAMLADETPHPAP